MLGEALPQPSGGAGKSARKCRSSGSLWGRGVGCVPRGRTVREIYFKSDHCVIENIEKLSSFLFGKLSI
jgi:hypothetical protein